MYGAAAFSCRWKRPRSCLAEEEAEARHEDHINKLPQELLYRIFSYLTSPEERRTCAGALRQWLFLQAQLVIDGIKSPDDNEFANRIAAAKTNRVLARSLEGDEAKDSVLAAIVVGRSSERSALTRLTIVANPFSTVTDFGVGIIAKASPFLTSLTLANCANLTDESIAAVARSCFLLDCFELSNCSPSVTDDSLILVANACLYLTGLHLRSCPSVSHRALEAFADRSKQLGHFSVEDCPRVEDSGVVVMISKLPELTKIQIGSMKLSDAVFATIASCRRNLVMIQLENIWGATSEAYSQLSKVKSLQDFKLNSCEGLTSQSFTGSSSFSCLSSVTIGNVGIGNSDLINMTRQSTSLQNLTIDNCINITSQGIREAITCSARILRVLRLIKCDLGGAEEQQQQQKRQPGLCPELMMLSLKQCRRVAKGFLSWIASACRDVEAVSLIEMRAITDWTVAAFLSQLGSGNYVTSMNLTGCVRITNRAVEDVVATCRALRSLQLEGCVQITDWSVRAVAARCEELLCLSVAGCPRISGESLEYLAAFAGGLLELNVARCVGLSNEEIDEFRRSHDSCQVSC